jgi:hypothetical protein
MSSTRGTALQHASMIRGKHSAKELDQPIGMLVKREPPALRCSASKS